jgi:hypothetical protein
MDQNQIEMKLNQLEVRIQSLESSWKREKFKAEQEITRRWLKKEQLKASRLKIKVERDGSEYSLAEFIKDPTKWSNLIRKGILYRRGEDWYVRRTLAEDEGFLVLEV